MTFKDEPKGMERRTLLGSAGLAVLAAPAIWSGQALMSGNALAQEKKLAIDRVTPPDIHKFKVGSFDVLVVKDGSRPSGVPNETFGTNQSAETVGALLADNFLPTDQFVNGFSPTLIDTGSDVILFDTGFGKSGHAMGAGRLVEGMASAGYMPGDVTKVVLTHLHGDHIGGLMEDGKPAFPNATYITGQAEYDFWVDGARAGTPAEGNQKSVLANVKPLADKMTFIGEGGDVASGITGMLAAGHTPGMMIFNVESQGQAPHPDRRYRQPFRAVAAAPGVGGQVRHGQGKGRRNPQARVRYDRHRQGRLPRLPHAIPRRRLRRKAGNRLPLRPQELPVRYLTNNEAGNSQLCKPGGPASGF
jgi:glyoxylase-like metal-dependent hydrolase (beta-lactamase superfamily II)